MKPEILRRLMRHIRHLSDVPVSRNWYKTVSRKSICTQFGIKVVIINCRSYSTNTQPIWKLLYPTGAWESQVCSYYNFLILILHFYRYNWLLILLHTSWRARLPVKTLYNNPPWVSNKKFSPIVPAFWPAIGNMYIKECLVLLYR